MTPEEELALISTLLDEHFVPKTRGLGIYSVYGRVALLAEKAAQQRLHLTGGILRDFQADTTPEVLSGLEADTTPPTSN